MSAFDIDGAPCGNCLGTDEAHEPHCQSSNIDDQSLKCLLDSVREEARAKALEECALLVEDADVHQFGGWDRQDDGRKTLRNAAAAIRARSRK